MPELSRRLDHFGRIAQGSSRIVRVFPGIVQGLHRIPPGPCRQAGPSVTLSGETPRNAGKEPEIGKARLEPITIEGGKGTVELRPDGVIHLIWKPRVSIDVAGSRAAMATVTKVCLGLEHPMLVDMRRRMSGAVKCSPSPST